MSPPLVLKFGGTSLASPARARLAAQRVERHVAQGRRVAVVVSAPGRTTDLVLRWLGELEEKDTGEEVAVRSVERERERDRAVARGEDLSAACLSFALASRGIAARSFTGPEAGIQVSRDHGNSQIAGIRAEQLLELLEGGTIPVVSGFQGEGAGGETVLLSRGGSDITAVALAATLGAECHLVTDVAGVYDADPRTTPGARLLPHLSHHALVRLAESGARVVHPEAARLARRDRVPLWIYHFQDGLLDPGARAPEGSRVQAPEAAALAGGLP